MGEFRSEWLRILDADAVVSSRGDPKLATNSVMHVVGFFLDSIGKSRCTDELRCLPTDAWTSSTTFLEEKQDSTSREGMRRHASDLQL